MHHLYIFELHHRGTGIILVQRSYCVCNLPTITGGIHILHKWITLTIKIDIYKTLKKDIILPIAVNNQSRPSSIACQGYTVNSRDGCLRKAVGRFPQDCTCSQCDSCFTAENTTL